MPSHSSASTTRSTISWWSTAANTARALITDCPSEDEDQPRSPSITVRSDWWPSPPPPRRGPRRITCVNAVALAQAQLFTRKSEVPSPPSCEAGKHGTVPCVPATHDRGQLPCQGQLARVRRRCSAAGCRPAAAHRVSSRPRSVTAYGRAFPQTLSASTPTTPAGSRGSSLGTAGWISRSSASSRPTRCGFSLCTPPATRTSSARSSVFGRKPSAPGDATPRPGPGRGQSAPGVRDTVHLGTRSPSRVSNTRRWAAWFCSDRWWSSAAGHRSMITGQSWN